MAIDPGSWKRKFSDRYAMRTIIREFLAELMGTFILMMFGIGSVAQYVFTKDVKNSGATFLSVNFGWGLGVMFGVYWSAGVSGGHLNPAVSLAMAVMRKIHPVKMVIYWLAQSLGAFIASAVCYGIYYDLLEANFGEARELASAGIWSTYPGNGVKGGTIFGDQVVGTALLVGTIFALTDNRNSAPRPDILPMMVGLLVLVIGASFGANVGYGINPARDLIPRIFTAMAGWKSKPFGNVAWQTVLGELVGGVLGALLYKFAIDVHHPKEEKKESIVKMEELEH